MFGRNNEVGILSQSAAFILSKKPIRVAALEQFGDDTYNLTGNRFKINEEILPRVSSIDSNDGFGILMNQIVSLRKQSSTNQNNTSSRSHLLVILTTEGSDKKLIFLDLAGFEKPQGKENAKETNFINSSLSKLNFVLMNMARGQIVNYKVSPLTKFLEPYLKASKQTLVLYHVPKHSANKGLEYIKDIVATSKNKRVSSQFSAFKIPLRRANSSSVMESNVNVKRVKT